MNIHRNSNSYQINQSTMYGHAMRVLSLENSGRKNLADISRILWPAIQLEQILFWFNRKGAPTGYISWAYLSEEVVRKFHEEPAYKLHLSEWNEGDNLWIVDFVAPLGDAYKLASVARMGRLGRYSRVRGVRQKRDKKLRFIDLLLKPTDTRGETSMTVSASEATLYAS